MRDRRPHTDHAPHRAPRPEATMRASLPRRIGAVGVARRLVEGVVDDRLDDEVRHDASLMVTELVANSVRHASGPSVGVAATVRDGSLTVEVADGGPGPDLSRGVGAPGIAEEGGRGMVIVSRLAARWGVGYAPARVWFELRSAPGPEGP